jgi:adenylate kinase family enzyme
MDGLPASAPRVLVVGCSGAGKSSLARALAARLACEWVELDELFWGPQWTPKPLAQFQTLAAQAAARESWVIDGNYRAVRHIVWPRATHIVWLDLSRTRVMWQVARRTLARVLSGQVLWHGNRESWRKAFFSHESILLWAWRTHPRKREEFAALREAAEAGGLRGDVAPRWIVLRSMGDVAAVLGRGLASFK